MRNFALACLIAGSAFAPVLVAGCNATAGVAAGLPDMKALYTVSRKWEYLVTGGAAGQSSSQTQTWEVTKVDGNKATLRITTAGTSSESTIDLTDSNAYAKMGGGQGQAGGQLPQGAEVKIDSSVAESLTVKAGTYATTKTVSTVKMTTPVASETTATTWVSTTVGLVKMESTTKVNMASIPGLPTNLPGMPAGLGDVKSTMELQSFK